VDTLSHRHLDSDDDCNSDRHNYADGYPNAFEDTDSDIHVEQHPYSHANRDVDTHSYRHLDVDVYPGSNPHAHRDRHADLDASSWWRTGVQYLPASRPPVIDMDNHPPGAVAPPSPVLRRGREGWEHSPRIWLMNERKKHRWRANRIIQARARQLRRAMMPAERELWARLRYRQLGGLHFRRQHPIDHFSIDFYCTKARLCVEIDGDSHADPNQAEYDAARTAWLEAHGHRVIRFHNADIHRRLDSVLAAILAACKRASGNSA
jgi:very-short-patch-repair endonuclease